MSAQLKLFHTPPIEFGGIDIVDLNEGTGRPYYAWQCGRCGRRGMGLSFKRPDLLEWARKNHRCPVVEDPNWRSGRASAARERPEGSGGPRDTPGARS